MIKPVNIVTSNVSKELLRIAAQNSIPISNLYIKLNSVHTFVKEADADFVEIFANDFNKYKTEVALRDNTIEFKQEYEISVQSTYENYPFENMICEVVFEKNDTLAYLLIKKGSKLSYCNDLYKDFLMYITEQKLRAHIMLFFSC